MDEMSRKLGSIEAAFAMPSLQLADDEGSGGGADGNELLAPLTSRTAPAKAVLRAWNGLMVTNQKQKRQMGKLSERLVAMQNKVAALEDDKDRMLDDRSSKEDGHYSQFKKDLAAKDREIHLLHNEKRELSNQLDAMTIKVRSSVPPYHPTPPSARQLNNQRREENRVWNKRRKERRTDE